MRIITDEHCAGYASPGHPERPDRITATLARLRSQTGLPIEWAAPGAPDDVPILRAHSARHVARLDQPVDFDDDTPYYENIAGYARASVAAALTALASAHRHESAFSLMRPPGHHATRNRAMGLWYLNNIAIAALEAVALGFRRVAIFDFDVHHGNGTEDIVVNHPGIAFFSIHLYPFYPGTGAGNVGNNCFNYPVMPGTPRPAYQAVLDRALGELKRYHPDLVAVSAGFDAWRGDPLGNGTLEAEDFHRLGQSLRSLDLPTFSVLEGGYSKELPELVLTYLKGLENLR